MSKLLRSGLILLGAGLLCLVGMASTRWGPCGPSNPIGLISLLCAIVCFPLGATFLLVSGIRHLLRKSRAEAQSQ